MDIHKILIVRLSSMGDIILATPLVQAIRTQYPAAIIDFAIKKDFALLMKHNPHINHLIIVDVNDMEQAKQAIRQAKYDWVINIQRSSRATQLLSGIGKSTITTYSKQRLNRFFLLHFKWNRYKNIKPVYQRYFEAAEKFNIHYNHQQTEIFVSQEDTKKVDDLLGKLNIQSPFITLCPGAKFANKRWTQEGFVELIKNIQRIHSLPIILLGGPGEEKLCEEIKISTGLGVTNLAGQLSLLESAALLKKSKMVVANDSGLLHLTQSQKTPVVAIYGPTVKEFGFYPFEENSTVMEVQLSCRPCTKMGADHCPKGHHHCMKNISSERVYESVKKYLN